MRQHSREQRPSGRSPLLTSPFGPRTQLPSPSRASPYHRHRSLSSGLRSKCGKACARKNLSLALLLARSPSVLGRQLPPHPLYSFGEAEAIQQHVANG